MDSKYRIRFFTDYEKSCFADLGETVIPHNNTEVFYCDKSYLVRNITFSYGWSEEDFPVFIDVLLSELVD